MQTAEIMLWCGGSAALATAAWAICSRRYLRKLRVLQLRLDKARQTAGEHAQQMRRQIVQLQQELRERPARPSPMGASMATAVERNAVVAARQAADPPPLPTHGFAETQPFNEHR